MERGDHEASQRVLLLSRFRAVAFAALRADVGLADLLDALDVAVDADQLCRSTTPPLRLVRPQTATAAHPDPDAPPFVHHGLPAS